MDVSVADFWKLATRSRILTADDCQQLDAEFAGVKGAAGQGNAGTLGQWLVARGTLTDFQVKTLLAGRPGPFIYGDYCVYDRIRSKEGRLGGRFRAVHLPTRHPVLLHFFTDPSVREPQVWNALVPQIAWACWVGSPYICQCYQTVDLGKIKLVAIENLVGDSLAAHLTGGMRLAPADACRLIREAALGLAQMHQLGQAHGQLQPANFWLESTGTLKLLQFPLAGDVAAGPGPFDWTAADPEGKLLASADYAAPELAQSGRTPDPLTDIYGLGAVLFQALSGWPPFPGGDVASKFARHAAEPLPSLAAAGVPDQLAQVVAYLLAKDPAQRYQHAAQVAEALAYFVDPAMVNAVPATLPTAAAFDQWLEQQTRVPGMAAGAIPTATQWAAHSAAQYGAAQQQAAQFEAAQQAAYAAQQQAAYEQAAAQQYAAEQAAAQQAAGFAQGYAPGFSGFAADPAAQFAQPDYAAAPAPSENGGGFFDALQQPREQFDPLASIPVRDDRPQYADLTAGASSVNSPDPFAGGFGFAAPAVAEPPVVAPAPDFGGANYQAAAAVETYAQPAAAATQKPALDMSSLVDSAGPTTSTAVRKSARRKNDNMTLAIFGGVAAVLLLVGGIIISRALNSGGSGNGTNVADNGGDNGTLPPSIPSGGHDTPPQPPQVKVVSPTGNPGDKGNTTPPPNPAPPDNHGTDTKSPASGKTDGGSTKAKVDKIPDDGSTLWASPTAGEPMPLSYIASGPQVILSVRPKQMLSRPDADQLLPALGPWSDQAQAALKLLTGFDLNQIDRVIATMNDSGTGQLVPTFVIRTADKMSPESLLAGWGNPTAAKEGTESYYKGATWSFYLPPNEGGKTLVVAPDVLIKDVIGAAGAPPTMSRYLEAVAPSADGDRDVNLLIAPSYLLTDGRAFFSGPLAPLQTPFASFFGDDARGALVSLHFDGNFFVELRVLGAADKDLDNLSGLFASRVRLISTNVENNLDALNLHPYDRKLLRRFPEWMRTVGDYTRNGVEDGQAVLRCYLPSVAAHNVLMASELALAEQGSGAAVANNPAGGGPAKSQTVAEMLKKKTSLAFPRDTLERSLQLLFDDVGVKYEILGGDLQLEGITKNQSFGLNETDKPADEILRKIMSLANPDGKLIYVIKPKTPGGPDMVFITTRASAEKRGDKLPPELVRPATPAKKKS